MPAASNDADRKSPQFVEMLGLTVVKVMDGLGAKVGASNETLAHAVLWSAIIMAQRDIGGPGVCEWLRDQADEMEAGIMRDHAATLTH
jgi:hypothetical protein